jgi:hypothetical protein
MPGRPPAVQYVELAAGDDVAVSLDLPKGLPAITVVPSQDDRQPSTNVVATRSANTPTLRGIGWFAASSFTAGWIVFGALAIEQANALAEARRELTTSSTLDHHANLATTYAAIADSMAVASLLTGGVTIYLTLSSPKERPRSSTGTGQLTIGPASAFFESSF